MNHTPITVKSVAVSGSTTPTEKHRAIILSNTGSTTTSVVTLVFMDINGGSSPPFVVRLVQNSGPFYIPCRIISASVTGSSADILLLA